MRAASSATNSLLLVPALFCFSLPLAWAQAPPKKPATAKPPAPAPAAPQSKHYPILVIAHGSEPSWNLRIGMKGPERLDRLGYPPIVLEPAEVAREGVADAWTYRAKDTATGADVAVHLTREACSDTMSDKSAASPSPIEKFTFRAVVEHAQIGTMKGCARSSPDLFPEFRNKNQDKDKDPDGTKKKTVLDPITNFRPPVGVAYLNPAGQVIFKRGQITRVVSPERAYTLSLSHDGKRLLFAQTIKAGPLSTINEYDFDPGRTTELLRGRSLSAFWSPDDTVVAFKKQQEDSWQSQIWTFPAGAPEKAILLYTSSDPTFSLRGWADGHTFFATGQDNLYWIGDEGKMMQTISKKELCGSDAYTVSVGQKIIPNPINPDLLLVETSIANPPPGSPVDPQVGTLAGFFLYEIRSKRRVLLSPTNMNAFQPEWSRDGLQIFFTSQEPNRSPRTYRIFWDGSDLRRFQDGTNLVIGQ